ncbi:MAG: hypothetical protein ACJA16_000163 [Akkermansiaceae bacterium]
MDQGTRTPNPPAHQIPRRTRSRSRKQNHEIELRQMLYGKGSHQSRVNFTIRQNEVIILDVRHGASVDLPPKDLE